MVKKIYIAPEAKVFIVSANAIMAASGGVGQNSTLGNAFNSSDESYAKGGSDNDWD